ncbi:MAG: hypothetical protein ACK52I_16740 [Pseudomonadota bacterium]|jgi:hypothetical protein
MASIFQGDPFERDVTFAPADAHKSAADRLFDMAKSTASAVASFETFKEGDEITPPFALDRRKIENIRASYNQGRLVNSHSSRVEALADAAARRIDIIQRETGMQLENPFLQGYHMEARKRLEERRARREIDSFGLPEIVAEQRNIFNEQVNLAAERFPEKAAALNFYQPMEDQARAIAQTADVTADRAAEAVDGTFARFGGQLFGGIGALVHDPVQVIGLAFGAGPSTARSMAMRVAETTFREGLINAGLQALEEPSVQQWRAEIGLQSGIEPALENIGMAFLIGGVVGGGVSAVRELLSPLRKMSIEEQQAFARVLDGTASPEDALRAADAAGIELPPEVREIIELAREAERANAETIPPAPSRVDQEAHGDAIEQAVQAADGTTVPPAAAPLAAASGRPAGTVPRLADDAPFRGEFQLLGKPVRETSVDPLALKTDAVTFQYKADGDGAGVTERLRGVNAISPMATGKLVVFEAADGTRFVADGHQRTGLFRRLADDQGTVPIATDVGSIERGRVQVTAYVLREADGWTPAEVRAAAALKNIQEGSGTLLDTGRILRDYPALDNGTLPMRGEHMQAARGLAALSEDAWGMVTNGLVPPNIAAWVGRIAPDRPELHPALMAELARMDDPSVTQAQFAIRDALAAGFRTEVQMTMLGELEQTRSLLKERREVFASALKKLRKDKGLFALLNEQRGRIEATGGNRLDADANAAAAEVSALLAEKLQVLATRPGPISDLLNMRAQAVAEGQNLSRAASEFAADVSEIVQREGLAGLSKAPELKPRAEVEPGSKAAADQAEALAPSAAELEALGQGNMFASEATPAGQQTLMPGVAPVTDRQRADVAAARPLQGGNAPPPAGGLFDDLAMAQTDLMDMIRSTDERGGRLDFAGDLTASCKI